MISKFFRVLIICVSFCLAAHEVFASEIIRVAIVDNQKAITLKSPSGLLISGSPSNGRERSLVVKASSVGKAPFRTRSMDGFTSVNGKRYRGWVEIRKKKNGLLIVINEVGIEDYLKGVIAAEVPPDWEMEALKAQAVASRTYALYEKRTSGRRSYHILATIDSQVYNGVSSEHSKAVQAVNETKGLVLAFRGEIIPAFYHANCGGHTENASELWGIDAPYLKGVDCECQSLLKSELWEKRMNPSRIAEALKRQGYRVGRITDMSIAGVTSAGRVKKVAIRSERGTTNVPADAVRAALGTVVIPSIFFEVELLDGEAVFSGRGRGHGVGLCQWGAKEMAGRGHDFISILSHYYPGAVVERLAK